MNDFLERMRVTSWQPESNGLLTIHVPGRMLKVHYAATDSLAVVQANVAAVLRAKGFPLSAGKWAVPDGMEKY